MNRQTPSSLAHLRGVRASVLRMLPKVWPLAPNTVDVIIPPFSPSRTIKFTTRISTKVAEKEFQTFKFPSVFHETMLCEVTCSDIAVTAFDVYIQGVRYRLTKRTDDVINDAVPPSLGNRDESVLESGQITQFTEPNETSLSMNVFSHLYSLLYPPPADFAAEHMPQFTDLWTYQKTGVEFLVEHEHALLADDMGLGKTAECSIAVHVLLRSERIRRALIICPRAIVNQWEQEAFHWASMKVRAIDGTPTERKHIWESFPGAIIATPQIVMNDIDEITKSYFDLVVCDDISMLKNPGKITTAIRSIPRSRSWCLSGTPLENKPEDFTNVMQFVAPGLFTGYERKDAPKRRELQTRVKPYFLRRRKQDVLKDLPPKHLIGPISIHMDGAQWEAYRHAERQHWQQLQEMGIQTTKTHIFSRINLLLQLCNYHKPTGASAKADEVSDKLDILFDTGDASVKVIVFSQWVETLNFLMSQWSTYSPKVYHGGLSNSERSALLKWFKQGDGKLLLMSTKSGNRGLNLQESSYVFHFDRTWNPVDEMQAEDRCWRMGQERNVSVYRYMQRGTIEERINQVLTQKKGQFDEYVDNMAEDTDMLAATKWSLDDLVTLMMPSDKG